MTGGRPWLRQRPARGIVAAAFVWLALVLPAAAAQAQSFGTADLAGTWRIFQLATPAGNVSQASIRSYTGQVTFDATGAVTAGSLTDDQGTVYTVTGALTLAATGLVQGTLDLADGGVPAGSLVVSEARVLATKFTMVGTATVLGQVGLFTFVRLGEGQTFSLNDDVANNDGDGLYSYHEITPSDAGLGGVEPPQFPNDASWSSGSITFHQEGGCTEADLMRADGTIRAQRSDGATSFG
jgi:hypothetical protein